MTGAPVVMDLPGHCQRDACTRDFETWCSLCGGFYCDDHDRLPDGHRCLRNREEWDADHV
jgi:hypothetical protein